MNQLSDSGRFLISHWADYCRMHRVAFDGGIEDARYSGEDELAEFRSGTVQEQALFEVWEAFRQLIEIEDSEVLPWADGVVQAAYGEVQARLTSSVWSWSREQEEWDGDQLEGFLVYAKRAVVGDHEALSIRFEPTPSEWDDFSSWQPNFSPDLLLKGSSGVGVSLHSNMAPADYGRLVSHLNTIELPEGATFFATTQDETPLLEVPLTPLTLDQFMDGHLLCDRIVERMLQVVKVAEAMLPLVKELAPVEEE